MAEPLIGPRANLTGESEDPSVIGGEGPTDVYAPINNAARTAIFGTNPATGVAYTDAESAALNAGNNVWGGAVGYKLQPSGELSILLENGNVMTTGATYMSTSKGAIVPDEKYLRGFNQRLMASGQSPIAYDEYGVKITLNPNGPTVDSRGKVITVAYDAAGNTKDLSSFVSDSSDSINNPYEPGTQKYEDFKDRRSAYDLLYSQFKLYGLDSLVTPLKDLIISGSSPSEFTIKLRESDAYKKRFSANAQRVAKGLKSLSEAEYIELEDQYQDVMRRYGLPETYYARGEMGIQEGFNKFLEGDVSPVELEDRISTAQKRVLNANPEVTQALKQFYPDITNADILAYTLDPKNAIENIKRKVTTAEIGGAAIQAGLQTGLTRAEQLRAAGVTKDTAQQGFGTIAGGLERGSQLASIYGEDPYTQTTAEESQLLGLASAKRKEEQLAEREINRFSMQVGASRGAFSRNTTF